MPAYVVAMMTVTDPEGYRGYTDRTPAVVEKHGGKFLTRGQDITCLEGDYDGRMVLLEFPSQANVDAWYADPDYKHAMTFRAGSATMHHLLAQEGTAATGATAAPDPKL